MRQELSAVELIETVLYLLPEPDIVIEIVLHKLLYIFVRTASSICSNTVKLGLQLRAKMHFHDLRVGKRERPVKCDLP